MWRSLAVIHRDGNRPPRFGACLSDTRHRVLNCFGCPDRDGRNKAQRCNVGTQISEDGVAKYFFHARDGARLINDVEGMDIPSSECARSQAVLTARELLADAIKSGSDCGFDAVVVADERGDEIASVRLTEILPKRLR
jgi:uncharacterized protein DUF6894